MLSDKQLWEHIVNGAQLGEDLPWLRSLHYEFKRSTVFLRKQREVEIPPEVIEKLGVSALAYEYRIHLTGKWATMDDLQYVVGDISWLWEDWIPNSMPSILAGEPGTGKSYLALMLCKLVTEGLPLPNGVANPPRRAIFIDAEAGQVISRQRIEELRINPRLLYTPNLDNDVLAQPDLNNESHKEQLANMVEDVDPGLIVIDSMGGVKSGGENRKEEIQPTMLYLTQLVRNRECGLIIIHHLNKTKREEGEEIAMNHLRGSTAIQQFARSIIFMSNKGAKGVKLWVGKTNIASPPEPLKIISEQEYTDDRPIIRGFRFEQWVEETRTTKIEECQRWVVGQLSKFQDYESTGRTLFELGDEMWTIRTVKEAGFILERKGIIRRTGGKGSIWKLVQLPLTERVNGNNQVIEVTPEIPIMRE